MVEVPILDDLLVSHSFLLQTLGDELQVLLVSGVESYSVCSGFDVAWGAFPCGVDQLSALEPDRNVTTYDTVVGNRVLGGGGLTVKAEISWYLPFLLTN